MVTIPLKEYEDLRDRANLNLLMIDKITFFESRMMDLERRICNVECKS